MNLGEKIYEIRKEKGVSQDVLAGKLGVTRQTISNWENNVTAPDISQAKKLSEELGISLNELLGEKPEVKKSSKKVTVAIIIILIIVSLPIIFVLLSFVLFKSNTVSESNITTSVYFTCDLDDTNYSYEFEFDEVGFISSTASDFYIETLNLEAYEDINLLVDDVEEYFISIGGTCN